MSDIVPLTGFLAHQGGWDEVLLVGVPIVLIIVVLAIAKRRVDAGHDAANDSVANRDVDHRTGSD